MISASLVKELREKTGAGMMDCKKALEACEGSMDKAVDWLREKGIAKAAKKESRIAAEGLCQIKIDGNKAVILEVNSETDFVAKNEEFTNFVDYLLDEILKNDVKTNEEAISLNEKLFTDATVKLGEKLSFRRFQKVEKTGTQGFGTYIHGQGRIGVIVLLEKEDAELAKGLSMHIAANNPKYVHMDDIPQDVIEAEKKIQLETCKNDPKLASKPEQALANIVKGKVNKIFSESVLDDQVYLMDGEKKVSQVLVEKGNKVVSFVRFAVGEGIEKRHENFAEEVAKQSA